MAINAGLICGQEQGGHFSTTREARITQGGAKAAIPFCTTITFSLEKTFSAEAAAEAAAEAVAAAILRVFPLFLNLREALFEPPLLPMAPRQSVKRMPKDQM